ncbi:MAG: redox-regulated ATPase YchF [Selenomonadaceae bacterium]|nr:redox-regulated ATPase YchF [Selenomonadaceae bacterium]MBR6710129.1 redox-regulated ATPase YchF [Selenomonadaceae bacterium]MBR6906401.1 redox-regulated ATPase YchF [Selenomonadaceae bacterium]
MSNLEVGIVGLPNVGKSTLFNAITKAGAEAANYPFCTIEPNVGVVAVPDERLEVLHKMYNSKKTTPASVRFVDIAGLVKGASKGEGLGNKFLEHIRQVDAVAHVVRCFEDGNITHVEGGIDPLRDIDIIQTELCLADLEVIEKRMLKTEKLMKSGSKEAKAESALLHRIKESLDEAKPVRGMGLSEDELELIKDANLLTLKPTLYVANVAEDEVATAETENPHVQKVKEFAAAEHAEVVVISAKVESEIAELDADEAKEFLADMGLSESGLDKLIKGAFDLLGLLTFLTAGEDECRAWTITKGTTAPKAAGKIHTDIERGFIRAEIVNYDDLVAAGSTAAAREKGQVRLEGKDYVMQDGDVTYFRFNV